MKKIIFLCLAAVLIAVSAALALPDEPKPLFDEEHDKALIEASETAVAELGGLYTDASGRIISVYPYRGQSVFRKNFAEVTDFIKECKLPVYLAIPPMKMHISALPEELDMTAQMALFDVAKAECEASGATYIDLVDTLSNESLYFATDHHWTSKGAYLAYKKIITAMGLEPFEEGHFEEETVHEGYRGSDFWKSDKSSSVRDSIVIHHAPEHRTLVTTRVSFPYDSDENNEVIPMYSYELLSSDDPYTIYFEGNTPYITVRSADERDTLLIVRDSFASALAPFLALHYDIVMIDPRFYPGKLSEVIEREKVSSILILENMGSYTENKMNIN